MKDFDEQAAKGLMDVNTRPLQRDGGDRLVRTSVVGGPEKQGDRRVYLDSGLLAKLLDVARSSPMGRVEVQRAGVKVELYEQRDGHHYEVWTLIGADPKPEPMPAYLQAFGES